MRIARAVAAAALLAAAACARQPANQPEPGAWEQVSVTGPVDALRGLEEDLRAATASRTDLGTAQVGFNEMSNQPPRRVVDADPNILGNAYEDARRKAGVLARAVHARLGAPTAVDEINAADPLQRGPGGIGLKGNVAMRSSVSVPAGGPEIVRVTFALTPSGQGPTSVTVYGLQSAPTGYETATPNQVSIDVRATGADAQRTVQAWETMIHDAATKRGLPSGAVHVNNISANVVGGSR
ncbi:MAG TPA: hypothetical protein VGN14_04585 [Candidatus Elarobacter sp.]|jgi:hypothetical protein